MKRVLLAVLGVLALVPMVNADPVGGGVCRDATAYAHGTRDFDIVLHGGEVTVFTLSGDGDSDLDLYIYDENGNLIGSDTGYSDEARVAIRPYWTGHFTIRVVNRGGILNNFRVCAL
ncbi:MAG: hypothetical protein SFU86_21610 [Pirellulaceae bacterium]|nr:hypothetical protein [Pirellulaceae bacterium]